ncbi:phage minor tail protein L [Parasutterella muris]|uniref:Phage minor tail protein L n=1 Tax=Parasutterella muris TaxID=2565572 RepID=A0A6L6YFG9_9BURK|nr:phage minor tail protein L [Parasutterella muris]MVX56390.1 phage minor tail protein L [Parasutterella muris]
MTIKAEQQKLAPTALIELYEVTLKEAPANEEPFRFHTGTSGLNKNVIWRGNEYVALPIETEGFDINTQGSLPRPKLRVANVNGIFSALLRETEDLIGATLTRKRTFVRYLDAVNFPDGNPSADPTQEFPADVWFIDKKTLETRYLIEWELASAYDLQGVKLPRRQIIQNSCQWNYRDGNCNYQGSYFDKDNKPCLNKKDDTCPKTLKACEIRWCSVGGGTAILPFGGFPGATRT